MQPQQSLADPAIRTWSDSGVLAPSDGHFVARQFSAVSRMLGGFVQHTMSGKRQEEVNFSFLPIAFGLIAAGRIYRLCRKTRGIQEEQK
jgi:hypothetical protein